MDGFVKLNSSTSVCRPKSIEAVNSTSREPSLIVICSWMGANIKHVSKYTAGYRRLFPNASILLIQSTIAGTFLGSDITPAYEVIASYTEESKHHVLLHAFSNGGGINAMRLAQRLKQDQTSELFSAMILDSCPGRPELESGTRAVTLALPQQYYIRAIGSYLVWVFIFGYMIVYRGLGIDDDITKLRRSLNDAKLFSQSTARLYLCSKGDAMVNFNHVHEHAEEARQLGYKTVREELFEKAPHCALLNEDSERYWDAVKAHALRDAAHFT